MKTDREMDKVLSFSHSLQSFSVTLDVSERGIFCGHLGGGGV